MATFWRESAPVQRTCHHCHAPWVLGQGQCPSCASQIFDEQLELPLIAENPQPPAEVSGWA
jgi:RNA polymerase subunit RPABC4/transcription elongation factor Spt4